MRDLQDGENSWGDEDALDEAPILPVEEACSGALRRRPVGALQQLAGQQGSLVPVGMLEGSVHHAHQQHLRSPQHAAVAQVRCTCYL
jgi:hypothetical protein